MQPTRGTYLAALDHLRALAALLVIAWHIAHTSASCAALCFERQWPQSWPGLSWLEQGHTGVALFFVLSGYVFAHLTHGRAIRVLPFWRNRLLRLLPLLLFWVVAGGLINSLALADGVLPLRQWLGKPAGSWTIFLELKYYALLPLLVWATRRLGPWWMALAVAALLAHRCYLWLDSGSVQHAAYWTLSGRGDQFLLGSAALYLQRASWVQGCSPRLWRWLGVLALGVLWLCFDDFARGGGLWPNNDSPSFWWVVLPSIEGLCYGLIVIAYVHAPLRGWLGQGLAALGRWSYSLYLNHFLVVAWLLPWLARWLPFPDGLLPRLGYGAVLLLPPLLVVSALSYRYIELPWLRLRRPYVDTAAPPLPLPQRALQS